MSFNQPQNKKSIQKVNNIQKSFFLKAIIIIFIGVISYMSYKFYSNHQYISMSEKPFENLLILSEVNKLVDKGQTDDAFIASENISPEYNSVKDLLLGDASYKNENLDNAKSFYTLALDTQSTFIKKGSENRLIYISAK